ncbi:MAG: Eco57I restriction-modification methylase domain-containing protein [Nitrospirae bacterium]|nr:Eco57I restriction-modification methylase domain-containing protein [Nitrospirota bacterium]
MDYIVKNTVGRFLSERKPKEIQTLRILDPACGSGSFLIRAYKELEVYYQNLKKEAWGKRKKTLDKIFEDQAPFSFDEGSLETRSELNVFDKRKLVLEHVFGVDLDEQAVEVSRLSLMLKMLEGEHGIVPGRAVLPTLDYNIQCGNSLITGDVLSLQSFFKEDWTQTKPFDWKDHFQKIMVNEGGFDIIIGNPPYVRIQTLPKDQVAFFNENFVSATGNYDIYALFVEQGLKLLKPSGILGFILPHKFFQAAYGQGLRKLIAEQKVLMEVVNFRDNQIFEEASTYTCLLFLQKGKDGAFKYADVARLEDPDKQLQIIREHEEYQDDRMRVGKLPKKQVTEAPWSFSFGEEAAVVEKVKVAGPFLGDLCEKIFQGLITGADKIFIVEKKETTSIGKLVRVFSPATNEVHQIEAVLLKPLLKGSLDIRRYSIVEPTRYVVFPYHVKEKSASLIPAEEFEEMFPKCWEYLKLNKKMLESREDGKWHGPRWYAFSRTQNLVEFDQPKILTPSIASNASFTCDINGLYYFVGSGGGGGGGYGIVLKKDVKLHPLYVTALLNSKLLDFNLQKISTPFRGGFFAYNRQYIELLPIRTIDFNNSKERKLHDDLVKLVDVMLDLRKREHGTKGHELEQLKRQIEKTDREIDERVYELYGVTEEEQKVIEGAPSDGG